MSLAISSLFAVAWIVLGDSLLAHEVDHATVAVIAIVALVIGAVIWWRKRRDVTEEAAVPAG